LLVEKGIFGEEEFFETMTVFDLEIHKRKKG